MKLGILIGAPPCSDDLWEIIREMNSEIEELKRLHAPAPAPASEPPLRCGCYWRSFDRHRCMLPENHTGDCFYEGIGHAKVMRRVVDAVKDFFTRYPGFADPEMIRAANAIEGLLQ